MKEVILPASMRESLTEKLICFRITENQYNLLKYYFSLNEKTNKRPPYYQIRITKPFRPRTTGKKSQQNRINGFIRQICMWTGNDFDDVKLYCKRRAMRRGYPAKRDPEGNIVISLQDGEPLPESEAKVSVEEAGYLIEEIQQLAAELEIPLKEE